MAASYSKTMCARYEFHQPADLIGMAEQAAEKRFAAGNHPGAQGATPPESGGKFFNSSPPQMRRGDAPSGGVVLIRVRVGNCSTNEFFRNPQSPALPDASESVPAW